MRLRKLPKNTPDSWRQAQGKKAQSAGKQFETLFEMMCRHQGVSFVRIPSGARTVAKGILIREKSPFDCFLEFRGKLLFADLKTTQNGTFPVDKIKERQIRDLEIIKRGGVLAGYLVNFQKFESIYFFDVETLSQLQSLRESAKPTNGTLVGKSGTVKQLLLGPLFCRINEEF